MLLLASILSIMAGAAVFVATDDGSDEPTDDVPAPPPTDTLTDAIDGTDEDDILSGDGGANFIRGGDGNDQINGYDSSDTVFGDDGEDLLLGGNGQDELSGGAGNDVLHGEAGDDTLLGETGADTLFGHFGDDHLDGGGQNDSLQGGFGADTLFGGRGEDALHGGQDGDILDGGIGHDTLFGGAGNDLLVGTTPEGVSADNDYLNGGAGDDTLMGGAGDIFSGGSGEDVFQMAANEDGLLEIIDFDASEDQLALIFEDTIDAPDIRIAPSFDDPDDVHIIVEGNALALVHGGAGLTPEDIVLVPLVQNAA